MSDNGGEYTSSEFKNFCKEAWIKSELTKPFNPEQNGVAERKNRTIIKVDKAMLHDQDLPISFGQKHATLHFMFKIGVLIGSWRTRLLRRNSQE
jgi:transposase InsO family protein